MTVSYCAPACSAPRSLGLIVAVHAESEEITQQLTRERIAAGKTTVSRLSLIAARSRGTRRDSTAQSISAAETGCRLHIVHVSCGRGVELIAQARARGVDVSCETCPHYLLLTDEDMERLGAVAKCAPPLRAAEEQQDLWARLGDVTTIGSDHSPSPWEMKERSNFFDVWGGISGCQHLLPLLLDAARKVAFSQSEIATPGRAQPSRDALAFRRKAASKLAKTRISLWSTSNAPRRQLQRRSSIIVTGIVRIVGRTLRKCDSCPHNFARTNHLSKW